MAGWFAVAASYIPEIIHLARPLFTRGSAKDKEPDVISQQLAELQNAATQNAELIKLLATEVQRTPEALQSGAAEMEKKLSRANALLVISATMAGLAFCVAVYALAR